MVILIASISTLFFQMFFKIVDIMGFFFLFGNWNVIILQQETEQNRTLTIVYCKRFSTSHKIRIFIRKYQKIIKDKGR